MHGIRGVHPGLQQAFGSFPPFLHLHVIFLDFERDRFKQQERDREEHFLGFI